MKKVYLSRRWENVAYVDTIPSNDRCNQRVVRINGAIRGYVFGRAGRYWARNHNEGMRNIGLGKDERTYETMDEAFVGALERL